jgi:protease-4
MKTFFKMLLASILGMLIVVLIIFVIIVAAVSPKHTVAVKDNSLLRISLSQNVEDRATALPTVDITGLSLRSATGLNNILFAIENAKFDNRIKGIYLDLSTVEAGVATVEEIRDALKNFKQSGKYIIAYALNYSQKAYFLATVADKIYLNPFGSVEFKGLSSQILFFKGLLDKFDIDMQIVRHGKFKSAVEPFTSDKMSAENREQISAYIGSIWEYILQTISESRNIGIDELQRLADNLDLALADDALNKNFVDKLLYEDEVKEELKKYCEGKPNFTDVDEYYSTPLEPKANAPKIAVIYASGEILNGEGSRDIMSESVSKLIEKARNDETVKAIVFRVNSPGGSADASEVIARELQITREKKPVVITMGDVAASGGYWISAPASKIFAHHTTITGSIGVFGMIPEIGGALKKQLGITSDVVATNKHAAFPSTYRPLDDREIAYLQKNVENVYDKFITKVSNCRNLSLAKVDSIGQGRVWSGVNAMNLGLVDYFGGLSEAIVEAAKLAELGDNYALLELPRELSAFETLMQTLSGKVSLKTANPLTDAFKYCEQIVNSLKHNGVTALMPYRIDIK